MGSLRLCPSKELSDGSLQSHSPALGLCPALRGTRVGFVGLGGGIVHRHLRERERIRSDAELSARVGAETRVENAEAWVRELEERLRRWIS